MQDCREKIFKCEKRNVIKTRSGTVGERGTSIQNVGDKLFAAVCISPVLLASYVIGSSASNL